MKFLFFGSLIMLFALSAMSHASSDWKVIAETEGCREKVQLLAKPGEKYVIAANGEAKERLASQDGSAYSEQNMEGSIWSSDTTQKRALGTPTYSFEQPRMVDRNSPKLEIAYGGKKVVCQLAQK